MTSRKTRARVNAYPSTSAASSPPPCTNARRLAGACAPADDCRKWASLEDATIAALNAHYAADFARFGFQRVAAARDLVVRTNGARRSLAAPGRGCDDVR